MTWTLTAVLPWFNAVAMLDAMTFSIPSSTKALLSNIYVWKTQDNLTDINFLWENVNSYTTTPINCLNKNATNINDSDN